MFYSAMLSTKCVLLSLFDKSTRTARESIVPSAQSHPPGSREPNQLRAQPAGRPAAADPFQINCLPITMDTSGGHSLQRIYG